MLRLTIIGMTLVSSLVLAKGTAQNKPVTTPEKEPSAHNTSPLIEVKGGYFFFADSILRNVYPNGGWDVQVSGSYRLKKPMQTYAW